MSELKEILSELQITQSGFELTEDEIKKSIHGQSRGVMRKLTRKVYMKAIICLVFILILSAGIPFVSPQASQILLTILLVAYLVGGILIYQEYRQLKYGVDMSQDIHAALVNYYDRVITIIRYEELVGLLLYPVSASAGYFIGMKLYNQDAKIMNDEKDWLILIISLIIFTPLSHFFARWLNRHHFQKYLTELEQNIREMDAENQDKL